MTPKLEVLNLALHELGWVEHQGLNPKMSPWMPTNLSNLRNQDINIDEVGILVPQDTKAPDFDGLIRHAVKQLTHFVAVNVDDYLSDAALRLEKSLDKVLVHMETPERYAGIVDLDLGVDLFTGMKNMLKAGAKTHVEFRARHANAAATAAKNYLNSCYLGQTEAASFVASAYIPSTKPVRLKNDSRNKQATEVAGRAITESLVAALEGTRETLEEYRRYPKDEVVHFAVGQGVSYELLDSLRQVVGTKESEVAFELLPFSEQGEQAKPKKKAVVFTPDHRSTAVNVMEVLNKKPTPKQVSIAGEVIELRRVFDEPNSQRIRLRANFEGKTRNFVAHVGQQDYDKAQKAHRDKVLLNIFGTALQGTFKEIKSVAVTEIPLASGKNPPKLSESALF